MQGRGQTDMRRASGGLLRLAVGLKEEIDARLKADDTLPEPARCLALAWLEHHVPNDWSLNDLRR